MQDDPDLELVDAWRSGDEKAGEALFVRHFDALYNFFHGKISDDDVEDLLQNMWMRCLHSLESFSRESPFRAYLFGIARHVLLDYLRARYRRERRHVDGEDVLERSLEDQGASPLALMEEHQEIVLIKRALRKIPLDAQILFELHYWEKLTAPELSRMMEKPEGTIRSRLRKAKELLRAKIAELASSEAELASTLAGFDTWAERVRASSPWVNRARA